MKIKELIEKLSKMDPELLVVLSSDEEGNSYLPARVVDSGMSYKDGEIGYRRLTAKLKKQGYGEADICAKDATPCVVIWP